MTSALYYTALRMLGVPAAVRRGRNAAVILCYHNVVAADFPAGVGEPSLHMPEPRFREQMRWLAAHYDVLPLRALLARIRAGESLRGTAALTFDDAYVGVFEHARPVLEEFSLPATAFVIAGAPEARETFWWDHPATHQDATPERRQRWLAELRGDRRAILAELGASPSVTVPRALQPADWATLRSAAESGHIDLGAHTVTHRTLPTLSEPELTAELSGSRQTIERLTGIAPTVLTYPYGLWDERVSVAAKAAGYAAALTLELGLASPGADPWSLPRVNVPATIGLSAFQSWAAGLGPPRILRG
jgi:peptidoglycan/xylan/chitin deacetylase (PgdA/CDA1 family)